MTTTTYDNKTVFVTGANRGIGEALVRALLTHKVKKIYAGARDTKNLPDFKDARVVAVQLDITNRDQVKQAALKANDIDVLINNAGVATFGSVVSSSDEDLQRDMQVNYFGTLSVINSLAPVIEKNGGGIIANIISIVGFASIAGIGGYSASKAALHSATQAMRVDLKAKKIAVYGIYPGPIDTDMAKDFPMEKTSTTVTAVNILAGIAAGHEEILPDTMSQQWGGIYANNPKALEQQFAAV